MTKQWDGRSRRPEQTHPPSRIRGTPLARIISWPWSAWRPWRPRARCLSASWCMPSRRNLLISVQRWMLPRPLELAGSGICGSKIPQPTMMNTINMSLFLPGHGQSLAPLGTCLNDLVFCPYVVSKCHMRRPVIQQLTMRDWCIRRP